MVQFCNTIYMAKVIYNSQILLWYVFYMFHLFISKNIITIYVYIFIFKKTN